jgi:hypothetical protein
MQRVTTTLAARVVQLVKTRPAAAADRPFIAAIEESPARNAGAREEEVEERSSHFAGDAADAGQPRDTGIPVDPGQRRHTVIAAKAGIHVWSG